jgi:hypothetical protein
LAGAPRTADLKLKLKPSQIFMTNHAFFSIDFYRGA